MRRPARLQAARVWLTTYKGKHVVRGYAKWFGVDAWCAVIELRMLGVEIDPDHAAAIKAGINRIRRPSPAPDELPEGYGTWWDDDFASIAGFTSGGAPFGTPWEPSPQPRRTGIESRRDGGPMRVELTKPQYSALNKLRGLPQGAHMLVMCSIPAADGSGVLAGSEQDFEELVEFISGEIADGMLSRSAAQILGSLCVKIDPDCADWLGM